MKQRKGILQKAAQVFGVVSFILAVGASVWLYMRMAEVGNNDPISASLMASIFFFICVGTVLMVIGRSNLPSFKISTSNKQE